MSLTTGCARCASQVMTATRRCGVALWAHRHDVSPCVAEGGDQAMGVTTRSIRERGTPSTQQARHSPDFVLFSRTEFLSYLELAFYDVVLFVGGRARRHRRMAGSGAG